jgi:hypothetical protein
MGEAKRWQEERWHRTPWLHERGQHAVDHRDHVVFGLAE